MNDDGFLAEIAASPDDAEPYLVYSDALQLRGDPRGDLISIQHALETASPAVAADLRRREADLIERHQHAWLGPLLAHRESLLVGWRFGFVHAARVFEADALHALLGAPAVSSTLAELRLGSPAAHDDSDDEPWEPCQDLIDALAWHPALRRLHVCDADLRGMILAPRVRLPEQAKQLDTLVVQTPQLELAWDATPAQLRRLEVRSPHFDMRAVAAIREWPRLESLTVWIDDPSRVLLMLTRAKFPRLRHLGLCGTANTAAVVTEVVRHAIAPQLASLDLRGGTLAIMKPLHAIADRVQLDVRFNTAVKKEVDLLGAFGAQVKPQRRGGRPLTDRDTLVAMHERIADSYWKFEPKGDPVKAYRKLVASTPDPAWLFDVRHSIARSWQPQDKRDAYAALARESAAELSRIAGVDREELCYDLGNTCDTLGDGFEAECWLWQAVTAARWVDDRATEVRALGLIGTTRMRRGDPVQALVAMDRVLAHYVEHGTKSEQAWAYRQRGNVDLVRSEFSAAEPFYRRALEIYRDLNDKASEAIVLSELAGVLWSRQDFDGAVAILRESIASKSQDSVGLGSSYYNLGAVLNGMGRIDEAREAGEMSLAIFRKHGRRDGIGQALSLLGELAQRSNRHAEAEQLLDEALACHRERGAIRETGITLGNLSRVALDRAEYAKARAFCEEAVELHRECGNKYNEGMQLLGLVDAAIGEQRYDDALALADEALVPLVAINNLPAMSAIKLRRGFVAQLRGRYDDVERHFDEAIADTQRGNYPELVGWAQMYRAVLRAQQQRSGESAALLDEAERYLAKSTHGMLCLAMAKAVIARLAGEPVTLPEPTGFDARLLASFLRSTASDRI